MKEIIYTNQDKLRLDKYLAQELVDFSRSQIQKLITDGQIKVNNQNVSNNYLLKENDKIIIDKSNSQIVNESPPEAGPPLAENIQIFPEVIQETADYLIINKSAGLIVHPTTGVKVSALTDWLIKKYPKIRSVGEDKTRPGIVHRLDKEVSGIMVIALTQKMFNHLKQQFQNHLIKKEYLALVHGIVKADEDEINFPLERSKLSGKMVSRPQGGAGKESVTKFIVLKRFSRYTYLKVTILTGRTHQIRSHLQAYGHPIVGDQLYKNKRIKENLELNRLFLHAHLLGFTDLENEYQEYRAELPQELNNILNSIK